jgi:predicted dehydrogenase
MKKIRVGVMGVGRGRTMIDYCRTAGNAELVAICDFWVEGLEKAKQEIKDPGVSFYLDFDEFITQDMDAVILANYATEHAPYAIKAIKAGKHVFSEVLPVQTLKEAVELIETIEANTQVYAYGENYCYMPAPREMRHRFQSGSLGEFEYGEAEYIHNCAPIWADISYGDKTHWRNHMYATFYATHSIGPLIHITKLRPVKVTGFEIPYNQRARSMGKLGATAGIEMITLENGALIKSIHGDLDKNSIWFSIYGSKGRMESAREDTLSGDVERLYVNVNSTEEDYSGSVETFLPKDELSEQAHQFGHGGSDFYSLYNFFQYLIGDPKADIIDIYEALDMFLPGLYAYRSILQGGIPVDIPNLRDPLQREMVRHDVACTDPQVAKDAILPCYSKGNPEIPQETYDRLREQWLDHLSNN